MTEEILYSDMINHYSLKITEISDILTDILSQIKSIAFLTDEAWSGNSANAFLEQLALVQKDLAVMTDNVSAVSLLFDAVLNSELEKESQSAQDVLTQAINYIDK